MAPPAKRQKRIVLPSSSSVSDDNEEAPSAKSKALMVDLISSSPPVKQTRTRASARAPSHSKPTQSRLQSRSKTADHHHNAAPIYTPKRGHASNGVPKSVSGSPEKAKGKGKIEEKVKSGNIYTFFTKQAQRQQAEATGSGTSVKSRVISQSPKEEDDDMISDDDVLGGKGVPSCLASLAARKRAKGFEALKNGDAGAPSMSQKFMRNPKTLPAAKVEDLRPWAERFAPINLDELAVHGNKVKNVRAWFEDVINGRIRQCLLILKGAAGTGKTTTVQLLANSMDCEVLEWRNPIGSIATADGWQSMAAQFEEFLGRGGRFGQLDLFSTNGAMTSKPDIKPLDRRKRIILVEEFPNTFTSYSAALQSFRSAILQYLASNTPPLLVFRNNNIPKIPITPVVMIISETLLTTTSATADSFTAHRLLGPEIIQHPAVGLIEFNPIAPTLLAKAIAIVVQKESRKSGRRKTPGALVLKKLGEIGDIRSAIGSLEFMCLRGDTDADWGSKVAFGKPKRGSKEVALTKMEEESLEMITRREASLGIFHAVGKVVHNKRDENSSSLRGDVEKLPQFMSSYSRPNKSQVSVDELIDETGTDTQTFVAALHENYVLSCEASSTSFDPVVDSLEYLNGCIDALSDSDLLCPSWDGSLNSSGFGGGTGGRGTGGDILRQDEIAFQIAVRGILFSLPSPVKRSAPAAGGFRTGKGGDANRMFYPASLRLWRAKEEIESTIDLWVTRLMEGGDRQLASLTSSAAAFARPKVGTVESWKSARPQSTSSTQPDKDKETVATPHLSTGTSARKEMLLERLPYMTLIAKSRHSTTTTLALREMEKVTTFHGIGVQSDDTPDEDDEAAFGEQWATDKPGDEKSPNKRMVIRGKGNSGGLPLPKMEEVKLVLSDDDIED